MAKIGLKDGDSPRKRVSINEELTVKDLAAILGLEETCIVKYLYEEMQMMRTNSQILSVKSARQLARELGYIVIDGDDLQ